MITMKNLFIVILLFFSACSSEQYKPPKGPAGSWWLGGADGGAFINIKDDENSNDRMYTGTIYFDADQTVWYQGPFKLIGDLTFEVENHDHYLAWDVERLYLQGSSYLEDVNPIPPL